MRENKHMRIYFDGLNVFEHAVNQPLEIPPNTQWRYRNSDPLTLGKHRPRKGRSARREYLTFPQRSCSTRSAPGTSCSKPTRGATSS